MYFTKYTIIKRIVLFSLLHTAVAGIKRNVCLLRIFALCMYFTSNQLSSVQFIWSREIHFTIFTNKKKLIGNIFSSLNWKHCYLFFMSYKQMIINFYIVSAYALTINLTDVVQLNFLLIFDKCFNLFSSRLLCMHIILQFLS